jgi:LmbE family N-acetylglucosaminyl deacetylase
VHAHPDDETITLGGALARYSASGVRTVVVTCTSGDLGEVHDLALVGQDVASLRASAGIEAPGSPPAGADAGPSISEIGVPDDLVTAAVDVREYVGIKRAAPACYPSQMPPDHFLRRMPEALAERFWGHEYFSRQAGPPETDPFDGL